MIYHYCRVSTKDQKLDRQIDALDAYKPSDLTFSDKMSGKNFDRTEYQRLKEVVKHGDEVIVKELDRFGRNKEEIKAELKWFKDHGVVVRILDIPTTLIDFQGQEWLWDMINNIMIEVIGAIAEQEREKIHRRMMEGIAAKKARDDWDDYGRPEKKIDEDLFTELRGKQQSGELSVAKCCEQLGISRGTWYNRLKDSA